MVFNYKSASEMLDEQVRQLEQFLRKKQSEFAATVLFIASQHGTRNFPLVSDDSCEHLLATITAEHQARCHEVSLILQAGLRQELTAINQVVYQIKIDDINSKIALLKTQWESAESDVRRIDICFDEERYRFYKKVKWGLAVGECLFASYALLNLGDSYLTSAIVGASFGLAQILAVEHGVQLIKKIENQKKRIWAYRLGVACAIATSVTLGIMREHTMQSGSASSMPGLSVAIFALFNLAFLLATGLIVLNVYPSEEVANRIAKRDSLIKQITAIKAEIQTLEKEKALLIAELQSFLTFCSAVEHAEHKLHNLVQAQYLQDFGAYVTENLSKRPDKQTPVSFNNPPKSLFNSN